MRPYAGRKIGQAGYELVLSIFFSFFIHAAIVAATLFLFLASAPKAFLPPAYMVKLVGGGEVKKQEPAAVPATAKPEKKPPAAGLPAKAKQKVSKPPKPARVKSVKNAMPAPAKKTGKPVVEAPASPAAAAKAEQAVAPVAAAKPEGKTEGVAVSSSSQEFKYSYYLENMRDKIEHNWNAPPGVQGSKATVQFTVLRSGRVADTKLINSSGNFYFDQAAMRAIILSSPFPPMPDGFYKPSEVFSVDLMEKE